MVFGQDTERKRQERAMREAGRLPPGQSLTLKWPVLHEGSVPRFDPKTWDFRVTGLVERPLRLTWDDFSHLPMSAVTADMHCVTRWSRFDVRWEGVAFSEVMKLISLKPECEICDGSRGARLHFECAAGGFDAPDDAFCAEAQWRTAARGAWLSGASGGAASLRVEKREVGARPGIHGRTMRPDSGNRMATTCTAIRSRSSATVSKRPTTRASGVRKSQQAKQFFKLASQLQDSEKPAERRRVRKKLARLTFGE